MRSGAEETDAVGERWHEIYEGVQALLASDGAVRNPAVYPHWLGSDRFWYERQDAEGAVEFRVVDAASGTGHVLFEMHEIATRLERELGRAVDPAVLILTAIDVGLQLRTVTFDALGSSWRLDLESRALSRVERGDGGGRAISPDGATAIFGKDHNLWACDLASGTERPITEDGEEANAYGEPPSALRPFSERMGRPPEGLWSPDSRFYLTLQTDERHVPEVPLIDFAPEGGVRPTVTANRTSLPGDARPTEFRVLAIEVATGRHVEARCARLPAVRMNETIFGSGLAWWSEDAATAYFVDIERGERRASVVGFDVATGRCRTIFSEDSDTYVEMGVNVYGRALIEPLPASNELIWYSERTGRGHLYLYDLEHGACRNPITAGDWQVREILHVDAERREIAINAGGIAGDEDPYLRKPCIAPFDGGDVRILSAEPRSDHTVWWGCEYTLMVFAMMTGTDTDGVSGFSPDGAYFVETIGAADRLPVSVLRDRSGARIAVLEEADGSSLPPNWRWPEPFTVKAADGTTDVYGLLYTPARFDPARSYPIIDLIYGGPQSRYVPKAPFAQLDATLTLLELASLAEIGAFAFVVDGRGTAEREQRFRTASHGALETASDLADHVATARALAERHPQIDLERAGITGFSGGGYMAAMAACRHGDFFKATVAGSGNYDQALFWSTWGERYQGLHEDELYRRQAVKTYADGLQGEVLFTHGLRDGGVHPAGLFQLIQALIEADKDFELVLLPTVGHELTGYAIRKRLDHFVRHLVGERPRADVRFTVPTDRFRARIEANAAAARGRGREAGN